MRRKDREITTKQELQAIIDACAVCRLGLSDNGQPYVLPLNFGYTWDEGEPLTFYFHCAHEGRKLAILAQNGRVCCELDCGHQLVSGQKACSYSFAYASLIAFGQARVISEATEKTRALQAIMERQVGPGAYSFSQAELASVTIFAVRAEEVTGKRNIKQTP